MIGSPVEALAQRARTIAATQELEAVPSISSVGGGSLPGETMPSFAVRIAIDQPDELAKRLRTGSPRVFPIIRDGAVLIDLRTVQSSQDLALAGAIERALI